MRVDGIRVEAAPDANRVRLLGEVQYDRGEPNRETVWYEVPSALASELSRSGNPWLAALLPVAMHRQKPLRIDAPVDPVLLDNARNLVQIWSGWYPHLSPIRVEVETGIRQSAGSDRTALLFSGGADAALTVMHRAPVQPGSPPGSFRVDPADLLTIHGLDLRLQISEGYARVAAAAQRVAEEHGCGFVPLATNIRQTQAKWAPWGPLSHGSILLSAALALEGRYRNAVISSTYDYGSLKPWGSHPLTDPLHSTSSLQVEHFGCRFHRVEKVVTLAEWGSDSLLAGLRVCYRSQDGKNCGNCQKCFRAMAVLEMLGALDRCTLFPPGSFSLKRFAQVFTSPRITSSITGIRDLALERGRLDFVRACEQGRRRSIIVEPVIRLADRLRDNPRHALTNKRFRRVLGQHFIL